MKALLQSLHLLLSITAAGSIKLNWPQSYYVSSDRQLTLWSSMVMEDIPILATYNTTREFVFKQSWAKGNRTEDYWSLYNVFLSKYFSAFHIHINRIHKELVIKGAYTVQCWTGCPTSSIVNEEAFTYRLAVEGKNLVHLKDAEKVWVAGNMHCSKSVQKIMQKDRQTLENIQKQVKVLCQQLATIFFDVGKEAFSRKIQPQVYITSKSFKSETDIICMVTGFYPKPINVSLWKENKMEDVLSTDILPNGDGTYQITVLKSLNLTKQQSVYCKVEHDSLKEPLRVYLNNKHNRPSRLLAGITITGFFSAITMACFLIQHKKHREHLIIQGSAIDSHWLIPAFLDLLVIRSQKSNKTSQNLLAPEPFIDHQLIFGGLRHIHRAQSSFSEPDEQIVLEDLA